MRGVIYSGPLLSASGEWVLAVVTVVEDVFLQKPNETVDVVIREAIDIFKEILEQVVELRTDHSVSFRLSRLSRMFASATVLI